MKHSSLQLRTQQQHFSPALVLQTDSHGFAANCSASIILPSLFISVTRLFSHSQLHWHIPSASVYLPAIVRLYHLCMRTRQREPVCARAERERLTKGCYGLSSLTLARLSCARKYKANYKPITQMDISSSDAPWVVQTVRDIWRLNECMKASDSVPGAHQQRQSWIENTLHTEQCVSFSNNRYNSADDIHRWSHH